MVNQHFRWDFVGLSTDEKPTPETSEKVVDGSTFYCSDTSKLYVYCKDNWYERLPLGGGGGTSYTAGDGIDISNNTISVDTETIQPKLTAGTNITIDANNEISATDTTYSNFTGTDGSSAGTAGLVPAPATTDVGKFLKADGTWDTAGGSSINVVQSMGTSTTDVMSQNATTSMVHPSDDTNHRRIAIGQYALAPSDNTISIGYRAQSGNGANNIVIGSSAAVTSTTSYGMSIGKSASCFGNGSIAIGENAKTNATSSIALGSWAETTKTGELNIGTGRQSAGYASSTYRIIRGVYDGQSVHDAATVAQGNTLATSAPTASTVGVLGQLYTDTTNMHTYQCTAIDTTDPDNPSYTWTQRW